MKQPNLFNLNLIILNHSPNQQICLHPTFIQTDEPKHQNKQLKNWFWVTKRKKNKKNNRKVPHPNENDDYPKNRNFQLVEYCELIRKLTDALSGSWSKFHWVIVIGANYVKLCKQILLSYFHKVFATIYVKVNKKSAEGYIKDKVNKKRKNEKFSNIYTDNISCTAISTMRKRKIQY
ncbi:hypothetical protein Bhyg_04267 [Pseudolycoriella hygida]|uniref:Uncharacterized protein n=1 Tax=Pseudolycoriella hygida TaxID=35572 RepID=A0A9Q0NF39_9DIPT|nr:hypothetical protein Bhyg_04267 [Pseudolycoriella hygida]